MKTCDRCGNTYAADAHNFYRYSASPDGLTKSCKTCYNLARGSSGRKRQSRRHQEPEAATVVTSTGYVASRELLQIWSAIQVPSEAGDHPLNLMFLGPSGCGKTTAAEYLADVAGVPFTKVDASAMTDPEAWFGTREVVSRDGVSVTTYRPSTFVQAITQPGVLLVDEVNRVRDEHRNILLPLFDGTHQITNPLTGELVVKHPRCFIIMSGNRGLQFTGTYAVDPALMTRSVIVEFAYLSADDEARVAVARTNCAPEIATLFVRFANETRSRVAQDPDMLPVSTREILAACTLVARGLNPDLAAQICVLNGSSDEGGTDSVRHRLMNIWAGIRKG